MLASPDDTPVLELDRADYAAFLEDEVRARTGMSMHEFVKAYIAGDLDDSDPDVPLLAGLLWIGQTPT
jgi:hypothetical protein